MRRFKHSPFVLLLIVLLGGSVRGQNPHFVFESPLSGNSFSASSITRILQDRQGFLWFGTWTGLARYDGYDLKIFSQSSVNSCGLAGNKITCLYEDPDGTLWVGTRNTGLYRFNRSSEHFECCSTAFGIKDEPPVHNITSVFRDRRGRFWIGAEEGLLLFDPALKSFSKIPLNAQTPEPGQNLYLYSILQTDDGSVWVGGSHGLFRGDGNAATPVLQQILLHDPGQSLSTQSIEFQNFVYAVHISSKRPDILWAGTKQGLKRLDFSAGDQIHPLVYTYSHREQDANSISHDFVVDICETNFPAENSLWLATYNGLNLLRNADTPVPNPVFTHFFADEKQEESLLGNNIRALHLDKNQILWIATDRGLNKLDERSSIFSLVPLRRAAGHMPDPVSYLSGADNAIWAGTFGSGFFRIPLTAGRPDWQSMTHYSLSVSHCSPVANFISALTPDRFGNVWLATQGAGAFCVKESDLLHAGNYLDRTRHFTKGSGTLNTSDDYLMSVLAASDGRIWMGGWDGGLNCFDPFQNEMLRFPCTSEGLVDFRQTPIIALLEASQVESGIHAPVLLWIGTRGGGLFLLQYDPENARLTLVRHFTADNQDKASRISHNAITSITRDSKGQLWVVSEGGIDRWNAGDRTFESQSMYGSIPQLPFQAMTDDRRQYIWVSTQNGLARLDPSANWQSISYSMRNGLRDRFFNSNAVLALPDGEILFGGNAGITVFNPAEVQPDPNPPVTALIGMRLFNKPVNPGIREGEGGFLLQSSLAELPELELSHRENVVSFEFTGLHFECPEQNRFAYRLKGFDPDWIYTDASKRLAHYTNLPPGDYVFQVKSANSDNVWNEQPAQLKVRVLPAWWWSTLAKIFYLLLLAGMLAGIGRVVFLRARYQHQIHFERLEKQKLEEVNQMKLSFFTNISHELKTPLTLIISPLEEFIRDDHSESGKSGQTFKRMHRNAMRLLTMINQLLDIRKAEAGLMKIEVTENDLVHFVREVCNSFSELAEQKNIALHFYSDRPMIMAWFDRDYMEKVFFNLLSNALKFTDAGGIVTVTVDEDKDARRYWVSVEDSGKGIDPEKIQHIFDPFYQAEEHHESGFSGGSGIGLSLVKTIMERHHGRVEVQSEMGKGSIFTIFLPADERLFTAEEKKGRHIAADRPPVRRSAGDFLPDNTETAVPHSPQAPRETVLLVEDNQDIRGYLHEHLSGMYHILEAEDGAKGLLLAMENPPDLVICDISMPGMDGLEFTRQLKSGIVTSHIPVILLTARNSIGFRINGLEAGADDYVTKPFNLRLLEIRIKNLIAGRRQLRETYSRALLQTAQNAENDFPALNNLDDTFMARVYEAIDEHLEVPDFSVDHLAKKLLMSRKQIYRKIKALTDQTPNELIRMVRLKKAAQLLKSHQYTVAEVTYKVGFQDLKYFRERFREVYGVTPSEYA